MFALESLQDAQKILNSFIENKDNALRINSAIAMMVESFKKDGRAYSCGNGGSMCDAMHFAEELTGRFRKERKPVAAMAINDISHVTCVANDYGYDFVFSRYVEAWGKKGDILLAISTSGNSKNIILAVEAAKKKGKELQDKAEDSVKLAKEKGTPVLEGMANDLREKVISAAQEVIDKLEEK